MRNYKDTESLVHNLDDYLARRNSGAITRFKSSLRNSLNKLEYHDLSEFTLFINAIFTMINRPDFTLSALILPITLIFLLFFKHLSRSPTLLAKKHRNVFIVISFMSLFMHVLQSITLGTIRSDMIAYLTNSTSI